MRKKFYRVNNRIGALQVRLVSEEGSPVVKTSEALRKAQERGLDLVEIVPTAKPPVARIVDFKKFLFEEKRKRVEAKKKSKVKKQDTKEFRFRPFIGDHDLQIKMGRARGFLKAGDKVKLTAEFRGREVTRKEFGREKLNQLIKGLAEVSVVEWGPEQKGRFISVILRPKR